MPTLEELQQQVDQHTQVMEQLQAQALEFEKQARECRAKYGQVKQDRAQLQVAMQEERRTQAQETAAKAAEDSAAAAAATSTQVAELVELAKTATAAAKESAENASKAMTELEEAKQKIEAISKQPAPE